MFSINKTNCVLLRVLANLRTKFVTILPCIRRIGQKISRFMTFGYPLCIQFQYVSKPKSSLITEVKNVETKDKQLTTQ